MRRLPALGACALAGALALAAAPSADGRITLLDDDPAALARALDAQPDGAPGLGPADDAFVVAGPKSGLPARHRVTRIRAETLRGRSAAEIAETMRVAIRAAGSHRVIIDELGPEFRGAAGERLAAAMRVLSRERYRRSSPEVRARRIHAYVPDAAGVLTGPEWSGVRSALARSGGVWLRARTPAGAWGPSEWLTWPAETAALLARTGSSARRVHVVLGSADQPTEWSLARTGSACTVLANGPGARDLGPSLIGFVSELRRLLPPAVTKAPPLCVPALVVPDEAAAALGRAAEGEAAGLALGPGGVISPPLVAGEPAQLDVRLGPDPLGLAAAAGRAPEEILGSEAISLEVQAPGATTTVPLAGDGTARVVFVPLEPGPVTMRLVVSPGVAGPLAGGAPGSVAELAGALRRVGAQTLLERVLAAPGGWRIEVPIAPEGGAPGAPVIEVVPPPAASVEPPPPEAPLPPPGEVAPQEPAPEPAPSAPPSPSAPPG